MNKTKITAGTKPKGQRNGTHNTLGNGSNGANAGNRGARRRLKNSLPRRREIRDLKRNEEAVRLAERKFREMIDALPAAIYTTDAEGRVTHFNQACVELSGRVPKLGSDKWCVTGKL